MADGVNLYSNFLYWGAVFLSLLTAVFLKNSGMTINNKSICSILIAIPFGVVIGLRSYKVGYDTYNYVFNMFYDNIGYNKHEFAFEVILKISRIFADGQLYTSFLLICSILTICIISYAALNFSKDYNIVVFLFVYYCVFGLAMVDQMRQLLACSFFALTIVFIRNNERIKALMSFLITFGIHSSSLIAFLLYFIAMHLFKNSYFTKLVIKFNHRKFNIAISKKLFILGFFGCVIIYLLINQKINIESLSMIVPRQYESYFSRRLEYHDVGLGVLLDIAPVLPILLTKINNLDSNDKIIFIYSLTIPFFRLLGYVSFFMHRIMFYPMILVFLLYGKLYSQNQLIGYRKIFTLLICLCYYILVYLYTNRHGAYPYELF